eukprot:2355696-Rhodomonas_salina.2
MGNLHLLKASWNANWTCERLLMNHGHPARVDASRGNRWSGRRVGVPSCYTLSNWNKDWPATKRAFCRHET